MYEVTDGLSGDTEVLTERKAERKFGSAEFTMMVAGLHPRYSAINLSVEADFEDCSNPFEDTIEMAAYATR